MKDNKLVAALLLIAIITPLVTATPSLKITKIDKGSTIIPELDNKAYYEFLIDNNGPTELYEIYTLVGIALTPKGYFNLTTGNNTLEVTASIPEEMREREGYFNFEYQIRGIQSGILKDTLRTKIVSLKNAVEISAQPMHVGDQTATITIRNKQNAYLDNLKVRFKSSFFDSVSDVSLKPFEEKNVSVPIISSRLTGSLAGPYTITADIETNIATVSVQTIIQYLEKEGTSVEKKSSGYIIKKYTTTKTNEGNIPTVATIESSQDIFSRLFTIHSTEPAQTTRKGMTVYYQWQKEIGPAETFEVTSTTNYTLPFVLALLIVFIAAAAKVYSMTAISVQKKVNFVKTQGGELALKVNVHVKARKYVESIRITDQLPVMAKLYEKFGKMPDKIEKDSRRISWQIPALNAGEERVYSYIIYSKMKVVGRFELPAATAVFERNGKMMEVWSNRAFFVSETSDQSTKGFS